MEESIEDKIIRTLRSYAREERSGPRIGIFIDGKPCYIGTSKLYKSEGLAIRQIVHNCYPSKKEDVEKLVKEGKIELRQM